MAEHMRAMHAIPPAVAFLVMAAVVITLHYTVGMSDGGFLLAVLAGFATLKLLEGGSKSSETGDGGPSLRAVGAEAKGLLSLLLRGAGWLLLAGAGLAFVWLVPPHVVIAASFLVLLYLVVTRLL